MKENGVYNIVFSSSATVYGIPQKLPINESHPQGSCTNPYGQTKYFIEVILHDLSKTDKVKLIIMLFFLTEMQKEKNFQFFSPFKNCYKTFLFACFLL